MGGRSFGSTYEGLKPRRRASSSRLLLGFGSTYEGLKLEVVRPLDGGKPGFGSTYEGLKRRSGAAPRPAARFWQYL